MLRLGHENGGTALLPGIIFLEHSLWRGDCQRDAGQGGDEGPHAKRQGYANNALELARNVEVTTEMGKQLLATAIKSELNPLLRLLHNDRLKLAKLTNNDVAINDHI